MVTITPEVWLAIRYPMPTCLMADLATSAVKPTYFMQASKDLKWCQAMDTEMSALLKNKT